MKPDGRDWTAAVSDHGGSLDRARALFAGAPEPFLDLSTGINPHSYPFSQPRTTAYARLPEPGQLAELRRLAGAAYGAPAQGNVVAAAGTQILLPMVMKLVPRGRARVLGPTYAEHARAAALAGHAVGEVKELNSLFEADLAIVVNPNNPDGRVLDRDRLLELAGHLRAKGGLLIVDEAFMDVGPKDTSLGDQVGQGGIVVLRSFGKFFGLAGLRLGFAIAAPALAARLDALLGPWPVSGPALEIGASALADMDWQSDMRRKLDDDARRLDRLLGDAGLTVKGGTSLFRYLETPTAKDIFNHCGRRGILLRSFAERPLALRIGLPGDQTGWARLTSALQGWKETQES